MSASEPRGPLVSTGWLAERLERPDLAVVDASFHLPGAGRDARAEFEVRHIPGAVFFDIDRICDARSDLPHMLPEESTMAREASALGLGDEVRIVIYDVHGLFSAARAWWMLGAFGHPRVFVLDGGLPKWLGEGRATRSGAAGPTPRPFTAVLDRSRVRDVDQMLANVKSGAEQVLDARSAGRFAGFEAEPRPGLRRGHIPGAKSVPFTEVIDPDSKTVLPEPELAARFRAAGVDTSKSAVASCGSGVTACALVLALELLGNERVAVYDGSWAEWGAREDTPVEGLET